MKKETIFKEKLLLSQEEIAILLGVTRSQWSMFELGQRDLPGSEKVKLAGLLQCCTELRFVKKGLS